MTKLLTAHSEELQPLLAALRKMGVPEYITYLKVEIDARDSAPITVECRFHPTIEGRPAVEGDAFVEIAKNFSLVAVGEVEPVDHDPELKPQTCTRLLGHHGPCNGYPRVVGHYDDGSFACCNGMTLEGQV